ncbi:MAG: dihydropteroate synthase [Desulfarculaceae bacterium]|jgi:cobalamin-dependent methionine synthase I
MLIAADNLTASRPTVRRALRERDAQAVTAICKRAQAAGSDWLDLNPGFLRPQIKSEVWKFLIHTAEAACNLKLMLDAPDVESLALALDYCTRPPVLNMATAQEERLGPVLDLAAAHGVEVVAATITNAVPASAEERLSLAALIIAEASRRGISSEALILDPMVMPLSLPGGETQAWAVIEFLRSVPHLFNPPPHTLIALSNLTTAAAPIEARFAAAPFLCAAWGAGLDIALMDALDRDLGQMVRLCQVFKGSRVFAPGEFLP